MLNSAKWIGSPRPSTNTYILESFEIYARFRILSGTSLGIAVCARDTENYLLIKADTETETITVYEYSDNAHINGTPTVIKKGCGTFKPLSNGFNDFKMTAKNHKASIFINGDAVISDAEIIPENRPNQPLRSPLMNVGLKQDKDCQAVFSEFKISNPETGEVYQNGNFETSPLSAAGTLKDGMLYTNEGFYLTNPVPSVNLQKIFDIEKPVKSAKLFASARGFYEVYLNNKKIGHEYFAPGFSDYRKRIYYQVYDVDLKNEKNSLGAVITNGYWSGFVGYSGAMIYGRQSSFIARLEIVYTDGTTDIIETDETWRFTDKGQVISADYQQGEYCDARLEIDFDDESDTRWIPCAEIPEDTKVTPTNGILENRL